MITDEDKQIAEIFKIAGFALMSPLGKVVLDIPGFKFYSTNIAYVIFFVISLFLFHLGIIVISKCVERVTETKSSKWNN